MSEERRALVVCVLKEDRNNKPYIFECPTYTLKVDDWVKVETCKGTKDAIVIAVLDYVSENTETFLHVLVQREKFKKVISKIREEVFEYGE